MEQLIQAYILIYNISEIFMITYFGNEILLASDRLTYSLFESDWTDQPHSTKKCVTIFGEYLKQSHQLLVAKLYPLTLVTFTEVHAYKLMIDLCKHFLMQTCYRLSGLRIACSIFWRTWSNEMKQPIFRNLPQVSLSDTSTDTYLLHRMHLRKYLVDLYQ